MGDAQQKLGNEREAQRAWAQAADEFDRRKLQPDTHPLAADAAAYGRFMVAEAEFEKFDKLRIGGRGKALERSFTSKRNAVKSVNEAYARVYPYKRLEWTLAALYRRGNALERFANTIIETPVPPEVKRLGDEAVVVYQEQLAQQTTTLAMAAKGRPEEVQAGRTQPAPPARKEPGEWKKARTPPRGRAAKYQEQVTGHSSQEGYHVGEVEFDGYIPDDSTLVHVENLDGMLLDAKGKGYARFFKENLKPQEWFEKTGAKKLAEQAERQVKAAAGTGARIRWHVAEEHAARAIENLLKNTKGRVIVIDVVYTPMQ